MSTSLVEAFELVAQSQQLLPRLEAAATEIGKFDSLVSEKTWIEIAQKRLTDACADTPADLLLRALRLPELQSARADHAKTVQGAVVDALEHLQASITYAGGARAPLLEALYYKLKIPVLRKCDPAELEAFWSDFEKRLKATYVKRILANEDYALVVTALEELRAAYQTWSGIFVAEPIEGEAADAVRAELEVAANRLQVAGRQARLLAQAALVPLKGLDVAALLALRAKKRNDDNHPLLEQDPPDPLAPTPEERAELELAQGDP